MTKLVNKTKKTYLYEVHKELGAKLIDFGGWEMPVQYTGIIDEHNAVRNSCGLFDVSHMGEINVKGKNALDFLQYIVTNNVARLNIGQALYTPMCYENGGIVDDLLIYRQGKEEFLLVVNAANTEKDFKWLQKKSKDVSAKFKANNLLVDNCSQQYSLLALQGPESKEILKELTSVNLDNIRYYWFTRGNVAKAETIISRTGYTGEFGYELYINTNEVVRVWNQIMEAGKKYNLKPAGLGARDTLRLEKGFCLYGKDIDKERTPIEAGLSWAVDFKKDNFVGREALIQYKNNGITQKFIGFKMLERGIPRSGYKIIDNDNTVGVVTSGSYSPTLKENIGLGYIKKEKANIGEEIKIKIRKKPVKAVIVGLPFV